jgi:Dolichyl-phosphate-mannose-protein mannosyltransferase
VADDLAQDIVRPRPTVRDRVRLMPWWAKVLVIFVASRIITTIILSIFAWFQAINPWGGAHPDYFKFAEIWDGTWYKIVVTSGYPSQLTFDSAGHIQQNAWAFLPAYPYVCRGVMALTGLPFDVVGVLVSVVCALAAAMVFYKLLEPRLGSSTALFSVVLFCVAPLSPILQVDYAESMQLLFLAVALLYLQRRQYFFMMPFVAFMSFTRPTGLAFALTLGIHVIYRWVVRSRDPFPPRQILIAISATIVTALLGYAWPLIAGAVTGVPDAYTATELSWRAPYVGWGGLIPFQPWIQGAIWWSNWIGIKTPALAISALVVLVCLFAAMLFTPPFRRLGPDLRIWIGSWTIYLLAVFFPQSSVFRLFTPIFPVLGVIAMPRSRAYRVGIVLLMIAGQVGWIYIDYWVNGYDWTPP